jgi:biotin synthase
MVDDIIKQSGDAEPFSREQLEWMLERPADSPEAYRIMAEAKRISGELTGDRAEVHAQLAVNLAPCPKNCRFCSFAVMNSVFQETTQLTAEETVEGALLLERSGANAVYLMTTAHYDFGSFLEIAQEVKRNLNPRTTFIANIGDKTPMEAHRLKRAGFDGVYHALRLREGNDTDIDPQQRIDSMRAFKEAELALGTCVEPVGPEHTNAEIAELILLTGSLNPAYSGAARRISIPGTEMALQYGMISELRQAHIAAVTRLGMPRTVKGNCTHEPCVIGAAAGANLFWAEFGANPRDTKEKTEEGRGFSVERCRDLFAEAGCGLLEGTSVFFA